VHEAVGAGAERAHAADGFLAGGNHQDRHRPAALAQAADHFDAVRLGNVQVDDQQVRLQLHGDGERQLAAGAFGQHLELPGALEHGADRAVDHGVVIDDDSGEH